MIFYIDAHPVYIDDPSDACRKRWSGEWSPEPETQAWIKSLPHQGVFFDVGANFGTFSVRASLHGLRVYAFEPVPSQYAELHGIIERNYLSITAYQVALCDKSGWGKLDSGRSTYTFYPGEGPTWGTSLDTLLAKAEVPQPDFIKLDVDGNELQIIDGAAETLKLVKSVLVEIDPEVPKHEMIPDVMRAHGFSFDPKQVADCTIKDGKYAGCANWIFNKEVRDG